MTAKLIEILIMGGVAAIMFWFAYAIGVKQRMNLIAGYNDRTAQQVSDKPGLARLIGRLCLLVGMATALMPAATAIWGGTTSGFAACMGAFCGFLAGLLGFIALQAREYVSKPRAAQSS